MDFCDRRVYENRIFDNYCVFARSVVNAEHAVFQNNVAVKKKLCELDSMREPINHRMRIPPPAVAMTTDEMRLRQLCRVYSFEHEVNETGAIRISRLKGQTVIFDKTFSGGSLEKSLAAVLSEYPLDRTRTK